MMFTAQEISEATGFPAYEQLKEWCEANAEGRLLILPCKAGAMLNHNGLTYKADHWSVLLTAIAKDETTPSGERLYLFLPEEAEAALREGTDR